MSEEVEEYKGIRERLEEVAHSRDKLEYKENRPDYRSQFEQNYELFRRNVGHIFDNHKKVVFLAAYSVLGNVTAAAKCVNLTAEATRQWRMSDEKFLEYYEIADRAHTHYLEQEAQRRAMQGVVEDVYYQGEKVGEKVKYSDNLLMFMLKAKEPEKYRDNSRVEVVGDGGGSIEVEFALPELNQSADTSDIIEG